MRIPLNEVLRLDPDFILFADDYGFHSRSAQPDAVVYLPLPGVVQKVNTKDSRDSAFFSAKEREEAEKVWSDLQEEDLPRIILKENTESNDKFLLVQCAACLYLKHH
jgi:hypothetical protein